MRAFVYQPNVLRKGNDRSGNPSEVEAMYSRAFFLGYGRGGIWSRGVDGSEVRKNWNSIVESLLPDPKNPLRAALYNLKFGDNSVVPFKMYEELFQYKGDKIDSEIMRSKLFPDLGQETLNVRFQTNTVHRCHVAVGEAALRVTSMYFSFYKDPRNPLLCEIDGREKNPLMEKNENYTKYFENAGYKLQQRLSGFLCRLLTLHWDKVDLISLLSYFCEKLNEYFKLLKIARATVASYEILPGERVEEHMKVGVEMLDDESFQNPNDAEEVITFFFKKGINQEKRMPELLPEIKQDVDAFFKAAGKIKNTEVMEGSFDGFLCDDEQYEEENQQFVYRYLEIVLARCQLKPAKDVLQIIRNNRINLKVESANTVLTVLYLITDFENSYRQYQLKKDSVSDDDVSLNSPSRKMAVIQDEMAVLKDLIKTYPSLLNLNVSLFMAVFWFYLEFKTTSNFDGYQDGVDSILEWLDAYFDEITDEESIQLRDVFQRINFTCPHYITDLANFLKAKPIITNSFKK